MLCPMRFTTQLSLLLIAPALLQARYISDASELLSSYDYIVVGGGTGGAAVASRLSEINGTFHSC